jgi:hypothetical protein
VADSLEAFKLVTLRIRQLRRPALLGELVHTLDSFVIESQSSNERADASGSVGSVGATT